MASIIIENNKVDKIVYPKNGKARVKQVNNPFNVYPYEPINQTPKFVKIKNIIAPESAPEILDTVEFIKCLDNIPIIATLPHVKKVTL